MAAFRLIPKEEKFFADFIALADRTSGATPVEKMLATDPRRGRRSRSSRPRVATRRPTRSSSA
ncbi:MAG: hypothetical protein R2708_27570 [Vicinamibacterales bacterium]